MNELSVLVLERRHRLESVLGRPRIAHDNLLISCCSPIGPIRFTGIVDWYTSSLTAPNEACQISPNLYEARNPQPAIADNLPICSFWAIRLGKSRLTRPAIA